MNEPKKDQEPSMEEILASIRRIISEDEEPAVAKEPAEPSVEEVEAPDAEQEEGAEILELTDIVDDRQSEDDEETEHDDEAAEILASTEAAEPDLDELLNEDDDAPEIDFVEEDGEDGNEDGDLGPIAMDTAAETARDSGSTDGLLEAGTAMAATASLSNLVAAVDQAQGRTPLGDGTRTVEDLVKEVMRPMVKEWLDENLPGLVDRLVRREIERLARDAEGED